MTSGLRKYKSYLKNDRSYISIFLMWSYKGKRIVIL